MRTRYIAFLRAINVGGRTVKMDRLRKLFDSFGCTDVETFIASGNVIFTSPESDTRLLEEQLEHQLRESLGYDVTTFIRSTVDLGRVAGYQPFPVPRMEDTDKALNVAFVQSNPTEDAIHKLMALESAIDEFHVNEREIYWLCHKQVSKSSFNGSRLERAIGMPSTMRNINTVRRIAAKYPAN
jgi:uncharacterized protein (DUF1697 family)